MSDYETDKIVVCYNTRPEDFPRMMETLECNPLNYDVYARRIITGHAQGSVEDPNGKLWPILNMRLGREDWLDLPAKTYRMLLWFLETNYDGLIKIDSEFSMVNTEVVHHRLWKWACERADKPMLAGRVVGDGTHKGLTKRQGVDTYHYPKVPDAFHEPQPHMPQTWVRGAAYFVNRRAAAQIVGGLRNIWNTRLWAYEDVMVSEHCAERRNYNFFRGKND